MQLKGPQDGSLLGIFTGLLIGLGQLQRQGLTIGLLIRFDYASSDLFSIACITSSK